MAKKRRCTKCRKEASYRTVRKHLRVGCTRVERQEYEARLQAAGILLPSNATPDPLPRSLSPPLPPQQPHVPRPPPGQTPGPLDGLIPIDDDDGALPPHHPDYQFDILGTGPSNNPRPLQNAVPDNPPTLGETAPWLE
ncbi:hypothetical protein FRC06_009005, partial [Ceratobasidium sp. 370]